MIIAMQPTVRQQHLTIISPTQKQSLDILQYSAAELTEHLEQMAHKNPLIELSWNCAHRGELPLLMDIADQARTLEEELCSQLRMLKANTGWLRIASFMAGNLNESGYLVLGVEEIADDLQQPLTEVEQALVLLQSLEPAGIGARSLQECLLLQIQRDAHVPPWAEVMVRYYLSDIADGNFETLAEQLQIRLSEVISGVRYIQSLNPRPGLVYGQKGTQRIIPDAYVVKTGDTFSVTLNDSLIPSVSIHADYASLNGSDAPKDIKSYVSQQIQVVHSLQTSISRRNATLLNVLNIITEIQHAFFLLGDKELKPLTLRRIADKLLLSESTISRAIKNKHVQTPNGLYELKYFFNTGFRTDGLQELTAKGIMSIIKDTIRDENKKSRSPT